MKFYGGVLFECFSIVENGILGRWSEVFSLSKSFGLEATEICAFLSIKYGTIMDLRKLIKIGAQANVKKILKIYKVIFRNFILHLCNRQVEQLFLNETVFILQHFMDVLTWFMSSWVTGSPPENGM